MDFSQVELGPKMQACTERERLFVWAYLKNGGKDATAAAREAGYSDPGKHSGSIRVRAHEVVHRERVLAAIEEVGRKCFRGLLFPALAAMENLIDNPSHPDHAKVVNSLMSRLGFGERTAVDHTVSGEVTVNHTDAAIEDLRRLMTLGVPRDKLLDAFGFSGLPLYERMLAEADRRAGGVSREPPKVIEHQVMEDPSGG